MYARLFMHMTMSHCPFSVSQVLCTNWPFLLSYSWLVTRVIFSSRRWGQDSPFKAPITILSLRQSLQDLSVERAIDVIDRIVAISTAHANPPAVMLDFCRRTLYSFQSWNSALSFWFQSFYSRGRGQLFSWSWWQCLLNVLDSNILSYSSWCFAGVHYLTELCLRIYSYDRLSTICCC